jgi:protein SCO1
VALALVLLTGATPASAAEAPDPLRLGQDALGRELRDVAFVTQRGAPLRLADLRGRPVVISMIYTSCRSVCPATTRHLTAAVRVAREVLGQRSFAVVSVGFDTPRDTPAALKLFAEEQRIADPDWYFVATTPDGIRQLAADVGFWFAPSGGGFDHVAQTTVLDARARVIRQLYGDDFPVPQLVDPLRRAALGAPLVDAPVRSLFDRIRLLCTVYDPRLGRYRVDYSLALSVLIALTTTLVVLVAVVRAWRGGRAPRAG